MVSESVSVCGLRSERLAWTHRGVRRVSGGRLNPLRVRGAYNHEESKSPRPRSSASIRFDHGLMVLYCTLFTTTSTGVTTTAAIHRACSVTPVLRTVPPQHFTFFS